MVTSQHIGQQVQVIDAAQPHGTAVGILRDISMLDSATVDWLDENDNVVGTDFLPTSELQLV